MQKIWSFIKLWLKGCGENDDFEECPSLGSNNCQYCPQLKKCMLYFEEKEKKRIYEK